MRALRKEEQTEKSPPFACQNAPEASFLLSIAGMFNGKEDDASDHVYEIVSTFIAEQQKRAQDGEADLLLFGSLKCRIMKQ